MTNVGALSDGWVQVTAEATNDAKREQAKAITAKTEGFEFRLPSQQTEILSWTVNDVTTEAESKPAEAEANPAEAAPKPAESMKGTSVKSSTTVCAGSARSCC